MLDKYVGPIHYEAYYNEVYSVSDSINRYDLGLVKHHYFVMVDHVVYVTSLSVDPSYQY
jgi:hypothetical protein